MSVNTICNIPKNLYKYKPWNTYTIDVFKEHRIYISAPEKFNDLLEMRLRMISFDPMVGTIDDMFDDDTVKSVEMSIDNETFDFIDQNKMLQEWDEERIHQDRETMKILCLTNNPLNSMMWYHYANDYKGVCLQFSNLFIGEDSERHTGLFGAVQYGSSSRNDGTQNTPLVSYVQSLFYKSSEWREENEYRYIE